MKLKSVGNANTVLKYPDTTDPSSGHDRVVLMEKFNTKTKCKRGIPVIMEASQKSAIGSINGIPMQRIGVKREYKAKLMFIEGHFFIRCIPSEKGGRFPNILAFADGTVCALSDSQQYTRTWRFPDE